MKILIVDDEPLVRVGIKSSYDWEGNGYEIAGEADDGEKALRLIDEVEPDIVILDIKMPKKDGLQVLKEIKERKIETYVIILSSFDDLDHVKMAMKLGAKDYFHKPAMNGTLIAEALSQFKNERRKSSVDGQKLGGKTDAVRELLKGKAFDSRLLSVKERNLTVLVLRVKDISEVMNRYNDAERGFFQKSFMNIMKEIISKEKEAEFLSLGEEESILLFSQSQCHSSQECLAKINKLTSFITSSYIQLMNIELNIGVGDLVHGFGDIPNACKQAKVALEHAFFNSEKSVFFYRSGDENGAEACLEEANSYINKLKNLLSEGERNEFLQVHAKWNDFMQEKRCLHEHDLKKIYKGFLFIIIDDEENYFQSEKMIDEMKSFQELSQFFITAAGVQNNEKTGQLSLLTKNILNYVNEHYQQDISLKQLAEEFYVSPNYISKLFNKEMERGLLDYVNEFRVGKAKKLLKNYSYKIYEVAEMVGFNSQVHFNIVFNKYEGMSPKEYRKNSQ